MNTLLIPSTTPVFHLYNRANDRQTLFTSDRHYSFFLRKVITNFDGIAHLLGYCIMPNHFHLLIAPKDPVEDYLLFSDKVMPRLPTDGVSDAVKRTLMGFTKAYNRENGLTGSRFQQRTKSKHHYNPFHRGLRYVHFNPVEAQLVDHPSEWGYSSFNEYAGLIDPQDCVCNVAMGNALLQLGILH
ncbi:transposase [Neolewinella litorea]|uniref:Transposase IS200-like domain-containing protein n=1 Tax=Neolewinella litorea TaxID=2562452 RepID=A0A4S4NNP5_9BACT|nr:transposase [Neolewinella litorea]THH40001.1 hypothetical protein E4021_10380 [Neolewinella litorea]